MCGIAGIVTRDRSTPSEETLLSMSQAIAHRGPDGDGVWIAPGVGFAHRRLAIIDLSPAAAQPMHDASGRLTIVFNGEIYNYRELRSELMSGHGAVFRTNSDTEVILETLRVWGTAGLLKLRGMFAFGLWDQVERKLLLVRDRIGKKPLFYRQLSDGRFIFASEIKALAACAPLVPDWQAVRLFLGLQYVPAPRTGFEGVSQLLPGTYGWWDERGWRSERYHQWDKPQDTPVSLEDETTIVTELTQKIDTAVKLRQLAADVPVGVFLAGGIDSAAVVAFASRHTQRPLQTFTMGFPNLALDERREARVIAEYFHTDHSEFEARPEHVEELADALVNQYDAPYADSSALPLWVLARETAKEIKVVLTGDGGDELFGGYRRYGAFERAIELAQSRGAWLWPPLLRIVGRAWHDPRYSRMALTLSALRQNAQRAYGELFCAAYFSSAAVSELCRPEFIKQTRDADAVDFVASSLGRDETTFCHVGQRGLQARREALMRDAMYFDLTSYLPDDLNVKLDRATMRYGLEARCPFLDQELVSYALNLPLKFKLLHGTKKIILRRVLAGLVPEEVLHRPKRGFQVPLADWFRGPLRKFLRERTLDPQLPLLRLFNPPYIEHLIVENDRGFDHGNRLWMLLSLSSWLSKHAS